MEDSHVNGREETDARRSSHTAYVHVRSVSNWLEIKEADTQ